MQYGNDIQMSEKRKKAQSLNRTMQYGNRREAMTFFREIFGLNRTMQYGNFSSAIALKPGDITFKSYYVVWKPKEFANVNLTTVRLNRTMQYGNSG